MSAFDPTFVRAIISNGLPEDERDDFNVSWTDEVNKRVTGWKKKAKKRDTVVIQEQLEWEAHVCKYVDYVSKLTNAITGDREAQDKKSRGKPAAPGMKIAAPGTKPAKSAKSAKLTRPKAALPAKTPLLPDHIPLYGPHFVPPTYLDQTKRQKPAHIHIQPETTYLKDLTIIHPFYFPHLLVCPICSSTNVSWQGWTSTGARDIHGVRREERALGFQIRCRPCKEERARLAAQRKQEMCGKAARQEDGRDAQGEEDDEDEPDDEDDDEDDTASTKQGSKSPKLPGFCFASTNAIYWKRWEFWEIPRGIPVFFKRCGVTRDLLDLIIEVRPSTTSAGLAENILQLHLLEYHQAFLDYLQTYSGVHDTFFKYKPLKQFSLPFKDSYGPPSISDETISEVFLAFTVRSRQMESEEYMRTLTGITVSMDATFKVIRKAVVVDSKNKRTKVMEGGILSGINEWTEMLFYKLCHTKSNAEMRELLHGYRQRCELLDIPLPEITVSDMCCSVRNAVKEVFPRTQVVLDVYHLMSRYLAAVMNGTRNPNRKIVAHDVVDAILKKRAGDGKGAEYWSQPEQEEKLQAVYEKWATVGTVWSAAAQNVHRDQLGHVQKGCLARCREDVRSDGSRIEGTNKYWNSIMRSHPSGIELFTGLSHDFVHRRNVRIGMRTRAVAYPDGFLASSHGSHHTHLIDHIACLWNRLLDVERKRTPSTSLTERPRLPVVNSGESFGLARSANTETFGGLLEAEAERYEQPKAPEKLTDEEQKLPVDFVDELLQRADQDNLDDVEPGSSKILKSMNIDPALRLVPQQQAIPTPLPLPGIPEQRSRQCANNEGRVRDVIQIDLTGEAEDDASCVASSATEGAPPNGPATRASTTSTKRKLVITEPIMDGDGVELPDSDAQMQRAPKRPCTASRSDGALGSRTNAAVSSAGGAPSSLISSKISVSGSGVSSKNVGSHISTFFEPRKPATAAQLVSKSTATAVARFAPDTSSALVPRTQIAPPTPTQTASHFTSLLRHGMPLPRLNGLSRTQRFYSVLTGIHAHSLEIDGDIEYYLFAEMRIEHKWASFSMTPRKWVDATSAFNTKLLERNKAKGLPTVKKHPFALIDKLDIIEKQVIARVKANDYVSIQGGTETFWRQQCAVVTLATPDQKPRKVQTCTRCKTVKYPGGLGSPENHRRDWCSDGVKIADERDELPLWPQPNGIYVDGARFNAIAFLSTISDVCERRVLEQQTSIDFPCELANFCKSVITRLAKGHPDGLILWRLYDDLEIAPPIDPEYIVEYQGARHLHLHASLWAKDPEAEAAAAAS